jgi:hypothetical protein
MSAEFGIYFGLAQDHMSLAERCQHSTSFHGSGDAERQAHDADGAYQAHRLRFPPDAKGTRSFPQDFGIATILSFATERFVCYCARIEWEF